MSAQVDNELTEAHQESWTRILERYEQAREVLVRGWLKIMAFKLCAPPEIENIHIHCEGPEPRERFARKDCEPYTVDTIIPELIRLGLTVRRVDSGPIVLAFSFEID